MLSMEGVGGVIFLGVGGVHRAKPTCAKPMAVDGAASILHVLHQHMGVQTTALSTEEVGGASFQAARSQLQGGPPSA